MDAKTVANYLIYIMSDAFDDLTNLKINKLLYYAQGHYLAQYGKPLFDDKIEAWAHGPVIPSVYSTYRKYHEAPIHEYNTDSVSKITHEAEEVLFGVARTYGRYSASALRNMTHVVGSPWDQVYRKDDIHIEIPTQTIADYFSDSPSLKPSERKFKSSEFVGYRDSDGILVLPAEWDDGEV